MFVTAKLARARHWRTLVLYAAVSAAVALPTGAAQAQISATLNLIDTQIYFLSDFDITGSGRAADLFHLTVNNPGAAREVVMRIEIVSDRFTQPLVEGDTRPFILPSGASIFTYRDFRGGGTLQMARYSLNVQNLGRLGEAMLRTGRLPNGIYTFHLEILNPSGGQLATPAEDVLIVSAPINLDLISPGQLAGQGECMEVASPLPQFTWHSDADDFLFTLCEAIPSNSGPEDVMQNPPRVQKTLRRGQDFLGTPSFQYPTTGLPLQPGRIYYWQVAALVPSTGGMVPLPSEIWCFRMRGEGAAANSEALLQQLVALLASLGLEDASALFAPGGPLAGFLPTGSARVNGRRVDLMEVIAMLRAGTTQIRSYSVEE